MPIAGIGADIVEIDRIRRMLDRHPDKFAIRILSAEEQKDFTSAADQPAFLAKRFAAKEAAAKALGTGIGNGVAFTDFSVQHKDTGQPFLEVSGRAKELMLERNIHASHISLSDESEYAIAYVVLETGI